MNIADLLSERATYAPDSPAIVDGPLILTAGEFDRLVRRLADLFRSEGLGAAVVGLRIQDTLLHLAALLAAARIGAISVPVSTGEADKASVHDILQRVGATKLVSDSMQTLWPDSLLLSRESVFAVSRRVDAVADAGMQAAAVAPNGLLLYKTSSGTTGAPKIVGETHSGFALSLHREIACIGYPAGERFMTPLAVRLDGPRRRSLACLFAGGTVVVPPQRKDGASLVEAIRSQRVGHFASVASHAQAMMAAQQASKSGPLELRVFRLSAGPTSPHLHAAIRAALTPNVWTSYGCSELGPMTVADPARLATDPSTVGIPMEGVEVEIADREGRSVAAGTAGGVRIRVAGMPERYHDSIASGSARFEAGWFYPGDVGMMTATGLRHLGRADDLMIFDGINIFPAEVEAAMCAHEAVDDCVAFPVSHPVVHHLPICAVSLRAGVAVSEKELLHHGLVRLLQRRPRRVVVLAKIPRNEHGKPIRSELHAEATKYLQSSPVPR